jgi:hypothetical protein
MISDEQLAEFGLSNFDEVEQLIAWAMNLWYIIESSPFKLSFTSNSIDVRLKSDPKSWYPVLHIYCGDDGELEVLSDAARPFERES